MNATPEHVMQNIRAKPKNVKEKVKENGSSGTAESRHNEKVKQMGET